MRPYTFRVNILIMYFLMASDICYFDYLSCSFTISGKSLKTWWVPYSNMIKYQMIIDNDDESAQALVDISGTC